MRLAPFIEMIMHFALFQTRVSEFDDPLEGAYGYRATTIHPDIVDFLDPPVAMTYHVFERPPLGGRRLRVRAQGRGALRVGEPRQARLPLHGYPRHRRDAADPFVQLDLATVGQDVELVQDRLRRRADRVADRDGRGPSAAVALRVLRLPSQRRQHRQREVLLIHPVGSSPAAGPGASRGGGWLGGLRTPLAGNRAPGGRRATSGEPVVMTL